MAVPCPARALSGDSEQFRSAPGTCWPGGGRLMARRTDCEGEPSCQAYDGANSSSCLAVRLRRPRGRSRRARSRASAYGALASSYLYPRTTRNFRPASGRSCRHWQQLGWTEGRNLRIDTRWGTTNAENSQTRCGIGRARARRHPGLWQLDHRAVAAGDPYRADRVPAGRRSGRRRLRR